MAFMRICTPSPLHKRLQYAVIPDSVISANDRQGDVFEFQIARKTKF